VLLGVVIIAIVAAALYCPPNYPSPIFHFSGSEEEELELELEELDPNTLFTNAARNDRVVRMCD